MARAGPGQGAEDRAPEADLHRRPAAGLRACVRALVLTGRVPEGVVLDLGNVLIEWDPYAAASLRGEVPGTAAVVRDLHAAGVRLLGLTNWSAELYPHAPATYAVLGLLDDVVVSGREGLAARGLPV